MLNSLKEIIVKARIYKVLFILAKADILYYNQAMEHILTAIKGSYGVIGEIARRLAVSRQTIHEYCLKYPEVQQAITDEEDAKKDFIEQAFLDLVAQGEPRAVIFAVRCLLRDRGYHEQPIPTQQELKFDKVKTLQEIKRNIYGIVEP